MASLSLRDLTLTYPNGTRAVDGISLDLPDGAFLALLGPSGCGKSSLLRMIAGLESPTSGSVLLDGRDVTDAEPKDRDVAMVFQGLALYPHMTVAENMSLGLRARRTPEAEIGTRVAEAAEMLGLTRYLRKKPRELSGGERQRVALGRALVRRPKVFLFDEPLSSLDAQLRQELREELARLHAHTRTTSVYVTHDQKEALSLGDRVAVLRAGKLRQVATPEAIYREPSDLFVARFVGEPAINVIEGEWRGESGGAAFHAPGLHLALHGRDAIIAMGAGGPAAGGAPRAVTLGVRPEHVALASSGVATQAEVERVERLGGETLVHLRGTWGAMIARIAPGAAPPQAKTTTGVSLDPAHAVYFDRESGARIVT
ncbi:MAG TPA: ABC transporter ATP-binding protein [Candidatus Eisenbacteria bacterium]|nr:ABC transporter ATP-binding protein [Candidatus Eisenbacteria bacterium]